MMKKSFFNATSLLLLTCSLASFNASADNIEWNSIKTRNIPLFYPAQSSWEWLLTKHSAAKSVRKGAPCLECHEDEENDMGSLLVSGKKLEPAPIIDKPGTLDATLQIASDEENLYFRISWNDPQFKSGIQQDKDFETKVAVMIGNASVREFPVAGCWGVCHNDATTMPDHERKTERNLYTSASRNKITQSGGGDDIVDKQELLQMLKSGNFVEYWQARMKDDQQSQSINGYILDKRHESSNKTISTTVENHSGHWQVTFARPLKANSSSVLKLDKKEIYSFGIAIHDDYSKGRFHYVSFPRTFSLENSRAQIVANQK